jgi:hypothetical protein
MNRTKNDGKVPLAFNHAMAKVAFSASYKGTMPNNGYVKIKQIHLTRVAGSGTLSLNASGFNWTAGSNLANYYLSADNGDLTTDPLTETAATVSTASGTFMLVPQTTSANTRIQLVAAFFDGTTEKEFEVTATLPATVWKAGKQVTYSLVIDLSKGYMSLDVSDITTFAYTGSVQIFTAPADGYYLLEAWGAKAGKNYKDYALGNGGYVKGTLYLKHGQKIYVYVGESNASRYNKPDGYGAFNGGGRTGNDTNSGTGGGATDFRLVNGDWRSVAGLNSRIMVAGGGGCGNVSPGLVLDDRGHAGGLNGYKSNEYGRHSDSRREHYRYQCQWRRYTHKPWQRYF